MRRRLDLEMVRRGLADSRERARTMVADGDVLVSGAVADKPSRLVDPGEPVTVKEKARFVGRGGLKLEAALDAFSIIASDMDALDVGASTGGFTDCLLQRGARSVVALDVGHGQLHETLQANPRVRNLERTNIRTSRSAEIHGSPFRLVVSDLSFISLRSVAPSLMELMTDDADLIVLVKPQFEAGKSDVGRGRGVITDPQIWESAIGCVIDAFIELGAVPLGLIPSPVRGGSGNTEFLLHLRKAPSEGGRRAISSVEVAEVVAQTAQAVRR